MSKTARDIMTSGPRIMQMDDSAADIAEHGDDKQVGRLVETISEAPDNTGRG